MTDKSPLISEKQSFNVDEFLENQNYDYDFIPEMIQMFDETINLYSKTLQDNYLNNNLYEFKKNLHALKGSLKVFFAKDSLSTCETIESILKTKDSLDVVDELFNQLKLEIIMISQELVNFNKEIDVT